MAYPEMDCLTPSFIVCYTKISVDSSNILLCLYLIYSINAVYIAVLYGTAYLKLILLKCLFILQMHVTIIFPLIRNKRSVFFECSTL